MVYMRAMRGLLKGLFPRPGSGRTVLKTAVTCGLLAGGLILGMAGWGFHSAQAFPFFHRHPKQLPNIPPGAQSQPGMIEPPPAVPATVKTPFVPPSPVQTLVKRGVFPSDAETRTTPITREEWAKILVKAIGHNTTLVSEFPFYRDVPLTHPSYTYIEVAREKKLAVYNDDHGFYYPAQPVTYEEAYFSIAHAITGPPPDIEAAPHLLQGFSDRDQLSVEYQRAVAKMVRVHFFQHPPQTQLHPNEDLTFAGAAPLVSDLIKLIQLRTPLMAERKTAIPVLPAGLSLTLSPATSILEADLNVGQSVSFTLMNPVAISSLAYLPKESRFEGQVVDATQAQRTYKVKLTRVKTPEGDEYKTDAEFVISFSPRSRITFLVPGELYSVVTQEPPKSTTGEETEGEESTGASKSVNKTVVPPFSPPATAKPLPVKVPAQPAKLPH